MRDVVCSEDGCEIQPPAKRVIGKGLGETTAYTSNNDSEFFPIQDIVPAKKAGTKKPPKKTIGRGLGDTSAFSSVGNRIHFPIEELLGKKTASKKPTKKAAASTPKKATKKSATATPTKPTKKPVVKKKATSVGSGRTKKNSNLPPWIASIR